MRNTKLKQSSLKDANNFSIVYADAQEVSVGDENNAQLVQSSF